MTRHRAARFVALLGGEWADLSSHVMTEADIQIAEARQIVREHLAKRRDPVLGWRNLTPENSNSQRSSSPTSPR